jgi:polysaccharide export outer membrane protein
LRLSNGRYRQEGVPDESIGENRPGNRSLGRAVPAGLRELDEGEQVHGRKRSEPVLGIGDTIDISVYRNDDLKKTIKIDKSGRIMFPLVGDVQVADRTVYDVRDELQARLAKYIVSPQVFIYASTIQSQKVLVLGEVKTPGILTLDVDLLITDAVMKAGGPTNDAKTSDIYVIRRDSGKSDAAGKTALVKFDMKNAIHSGDFSNNVQLRNGDIVYVPTQAISDVSRFMAHIAAIIGPIVTTESGIVLWPQVIDVFQGKKPTNTNINVSP